MGLSETPVRTRVVLASIVLAATLVVGAGCGSGDSSSRTSSNTVDASRSTGAVPEPLAALEASAEDVIDQVPHEEWAKITADVGDLQAAWDEYQADATAVDATSAARLDRALGTLAEATAARNGPATEQAANDVSAAVVELFAHYDLPHPVQIGRLDVIGRQIVIDASRGDLAGAAVQVTAAKREWEAVRADVLDHDGEGVAADADGAIDALTNAASTGDLASLTSEAARLLEIVDEMEGLYRAASPQEERGE